MASVLLSVDGVGKICRRGLHSSRVLRSVSLEVRSGELVVIFGERGSGKTTLLKVMAGFEPPDDGVVRFMGEDLASISRGRLSDLHLLGGIGWVHRDGPESTHLPMVQHIALPLLRHYGHRRAERLAKDALAHVDAEACAFETWGNLGDGDRAWVSLAQALVRRPRLLLVDDPTAGLDVMDRQRMFDVLRSVADEDDVGVVTVVPDAPPRFAHVIRMLSAGSLIAPPDPPGGQGTVIAFPLSERSA